MKKKHSFANEEESATDEREITIAIESCDRPPYTKKRASTKMGEGGRLLKILI